MKSKVLSGVSSLIFDRGLIASTGLSPLIATAPAPAAPAAPAVIAAFDASAPVPPATTAALEPSSEEVARATLLICSVVENCC